MDAIHALLLCVCPSIRLWAMVAGPNFEQSLCNALFNEACNAVDNDSSSPPILLKGLREVHIEHWDGSREPSITTFAPILSLGSLEVLRLQAVDFDAYEANPLRGVQSNTKALYFTSTYITDDGFECLLRAFPQLEVLSISLGGHANKVYLDYPNCGRYLTQHAKGLQEFRLTVDDHDDVCLMQSPDREPFESLKALTSLRILQINYATLLGGPFGQYAEEPMSLANLLPEYCLEELVIDDSCNFWSRCTDARLSEVMLDHRFDKLKSIKLRKGAEAFGVKLDPMAVSQGWDGSQTTEDWIELRKM